jgi:phosphoglycolate phosphatase-like HAD superfamily hydrolase
MYLILFDIDGTLVLTGRAGWRAMNRACAVEVGHDRALDGVEFAGRTDWSILGDIMRKHDRPMDRPMLDRLNRRYVAHLAEEIQLPGTGVKDVMPGIRTLIDALERRDDVALGLLTGNFVEGARIKLQYFDLWKHFPFGAFGDDAADRNDLVPVAVRRAREAGIAGVEPSRVMVIGDTPNDVECARVAGATPVAVATGSYTVEQLRETGAEIVFQDLSDTKAFLKLLDN